MALLPPTDRYYGCVVRKKVMLLEDVKKGTLDFGGWLLCAVLSSPLRGPLLRGVFPSPRQACSCKPPWHSVVVKLFGTWGHQCFKSQPPKADFSLVRNKGSIEYRSCRG